MEYTVDFDVDYDTYNILVIQWNLEICKQSDGFPITFLSGSVGLCIAILEHAIPHMYTV